MSAGSSRVLLTPPLRTESRVVLPRRARATAPCRQATTAGGARRRHRRTPSRSTRRGRWISLCTSCSESQVRRLHFLSTFYIEMIISPRHAPDKHSETSQKVLVYLARLCGGPAASHSMRCEQRISFAMPFDTQMMAFCQDRLGTHTHRKKLTKEMRVLCSPP